MPITALIYASQIDTVLTLLFVGFLIIVHLIILYAEGLKNRTERCHLATYRIMKESFTNI